MTASSSASVAPPSASDHAARSVDVEGLYPWWWDVASGQVAWSPGMDALFGRVEPFAGTYEAHLEVIAREDRDAVAEAFARAIRVVGGAATVFTTYRVRLPNASTRWIGTKAAVFRDPHEGRPQAVSGVVWDFTGLVSGARGFGGRDEERRAAEKALRASEERYRTLFEQAFEGIFLVGRAPEYRIVDANDSACRIVGYSRAEIRGMRSQELVDPRDLAGAALRFPVIPPGEVLRSNRRMLRKDGTFAETEVSTEAFADGHYRCVLNDVTDQRRAEAQLRLADRLTSLGRMASGIAHEINNPLAYVILNLQQALRRSEGPRRGGPSEDLGPMLRDALEGADRVRRIVRTLGAFGRGDEEQIGAVDVNATLDSAQEIAAVQLRHHARVTRHYGADVYAEANSFRLGQVFVNLLVNAADASAAPGAASNEIELVTCVDATGRVVVEVTDHGPGIPKAIEDRIFEPFFTTKPVGQGTGLGLSVCQSIVTSFGGLLACESAPGKTTFRVTLPPALARPDRPKVIERGGPVPRRARVLVVDDDRQVAEAIARVLEEHDVVVASGGREALERCRAETFDCVLCDLMMPEVTGVDVVEALRADGDGLDRRVVLLTGGAVTDRERAFVATSPNVVLEKPIAAETLREIVRRAVRVADGD